MLQAERSFAAREHHPGRDSFIYISFQNVQVNRLHKKQTRHLARWKGAPLSRIILLDTRVILLAGPNFVHVNSLTRSAGSTR